MKSRIPPAFSSRNIVAWLPKGRITHNTKDEDRGTNDDDLHNFCQSGRPTTNRTGNECWTNLGRIAYDNRTIHSMKARTLDDTHENHRRHRLIECELDDERRTSHTIATRS